MEDLSENAPTLQRAISRELGGKIESEGFLVIPDAFSQAFAEAMREGLADLPMAHAHRNLLTHPVLARFAVSREAMQWIVPVLGAGAMPVRAILFDKLPGANWKVPWHQDVTIAVKERREEAGFGPWSVKEGVVHVQPPVRVLEGMLTLRLHLDDCFVDNGPVRVLPGTHGMGFLRAEAIQACRREIGEVAAVMPVGGVLLMRPLLLHASSAAVAPGHRRVVHIEYAKGQLPGAVAWHVS